LVIDVFNLEQNIIDSSQEINHEQYLLIIKNSSGGRESANLFIVHQPRTLFQNPRETNLCLCTRVWGQPAMGKLFGRGPHRRKYKRY
jgi:hypothetical protein